MSLTTLGNKIKTDINQSSTALLLIMLACFQFVSHYPYLKKPAMGNHVWRQCNTLAMARNYYEEDMNILYPRIDKRYHTNGVTGPQFTSYDYTLAVCYKLFGFSESLHRKLSLIIGIIAIWALFLLSVEYFKSKFWSVIAALSLIGIPEFYYHSINAVPDLMALMFMLLGWLAFERYRNRDLGYYLVVTGFMFALAGMTKLMFLLPGFMIIGECIQDKRWEMKRLTYLLLIAAFVVVCSLGWYRWAVYLTSLNGLWEFVHYVRWIPGWQGKILAFGKHLFSDMPETWVGYGLIIPFVLGIIFLFKDKRNNPSVWLVFLGVLMFYVSMQYQLVMHGYYTLVLSPFFALIGIWGLRQVNNGRAVTLLFLLLVISPVWAWIREHHNWNDKGNRVAEELFIPQNKRTIELLSKQRERWLVGPDQSGCVDFYFLHAKGFPWYNLTEGSEIFSKFREDGAQGIITNRVEDANRIMNQLNWKYREIGSVGNYHWIVW